MNFKLAKIMCVLFAPINVLLGQDITSAFQYNAAEMLASNKDVILGSRRNIKINHDDSFTNLIIDDILIWRVPPPFVVGQVILSNGEDRLSLLLFRKETINASVVGFHSSSVWICEKKSVSWSTCGPMLSKEFLATQNAYVSRLRKFSENGKDLLLQIQQETDLSGGGTKTTRYWQWWNTEKQTPVSDPDYSEAPVGGK